MSVEEKVRELFPWIEWKASGEAILALARSVDALEVENKEMNDASKKLAADIGGFLWALMGRIESLEAGVTPPRSEVDMLTEMFKNAVSPGHPLSGQPKMTKPAESEVLAALKACEWAGVQRGQGTGPMSSGGDGRLVSACPLCRGINPKDPGRMEFIASAHGHQPSCRLHAVLVKAEGRETP